MKRALSVDEVFERIRAYDLVLTTEAPLADALNARLEEPKMDYFAITPRRMVYGSEADPEFRRELFLELVNNRGMGWKQASYLLNNLLDCWQHTGEIEAIKQYEGFNGEDIDTVIEAVRETPNPLKAMKEFEVPEDKQVAVIGLHQFNQLDRSVLPEEFDEIELFGEKDFEMPEFKLFESAGSIVRAVTETAERVGPGNLGVVMAPDSQYQPLVEASFEASDVPYLTQHEFSDDENLRTLISLLRIGLSWKDVRVRDIRPVVNQLDLDVSRRDDNRRLDEFDGYEEFKQFLNVLEYLEFGEVLERYTEFTGRDTGRIEQVFDQLGIIDDAVTLDAVNNIEYYLDSFSLAESETSEGVLFADPGKVSHVDRPVVMFLGMDSSWTREVSEKPWVDPEREDTRNLEDFKALIQSGGRQLYMVQGREMNEDITPCFHFNDILEEDFRSFEDLSHTRYRPEEFEENSGFEPENYDVGIETVRKLSQSSLNTFALSPRLYYFDRLTSDVDEENRVKGNLFHDYAEFYVSNREFAEQLEDDEVVEFMLDQIREFADELDMERIETEFRIGLKNIREFLASREIERSEIEGYEKRDDENVFAEEYGKQIDSNITEMWFEDDELGAKGKVDLILGPRHLVDYKSGRRYSRQKLVEKSNVDLYEDVKWPNFQALMYLAHHRKYVPDEELKFTFLNFLHNVSDQISGDADPDDNIVTITYYPDGFHEKISEIEVFEDLIRNVSKSNNRRKTLEKLGYTPYKQFFSGNKLPYPYDKDRLLESEFASEFISYVKQHVGDYKYVEKGCESALRKLVKFRKRNYFREDLDRFEDFLAEQIAEFNDCKRSEFPLDAKPDDLPERDMILR